MLPHIKEREALRLLDPRFAGLLVGAAWAWVCMKQRDWSRREFIKSWQGPALSLTAPAHALFVSPRIYVVTLRLVFRSGRSCVSGVAAAAWRGCPGNHGSCRCLVASERQQFVMQLKHLRTLLSPQVRSCVPLPSPARLNAPRKVGGLKINNV